MSAKFTLAIHAEDNKIKHISEVSNGDKCNCKCVKCHAKLTAVNNEKNKREHHFRHKNSDCNGAPETALHLLAKQIIEENAEIRIDEDKLFTYSNVESESTLNDFVPDIIVTDEPTNKKWLIEIAVTSFVNDEKLKKIKRANENCLEVNLKNIDRNITPSELKPIVLNELNNRKILHKKINNSNWAEILFWATVIYLGLKAIFTKRYR